MKSVIFSLALLMVSAAGTGAAQNLEFAPRYEAPEFSATYPVQDSGKPGVAYALNTISLKNGTPVKMNNYTLSLHSDADAFLVLYCDIPNTRSDNESLDHMLDGALGQLDNAHPGPKTDARFSGMPARAVSATGSYVHGDNTFHVTSYERITVKGDRIWQAIVICDSRTNCSEADANKFFDSIRVR